MAIIEIWIIPSVDENVEKWKSSNIAYGNVNCAAILENSSVAAQAVKHRAHMTNQFHF